MTVKTYNNLIDEMKELADRINKHYDTVTLETVEELDTTETETQRILNELKDKGVLKESDLEEADWKKIPKWPTTKQGDKIEYDEIGADAGSESDHKFVQKQFMEISKRLDWIAERFSEKSMLSRFTGKIGGDTSGFGKVSQAAGVLLSAVEELHRDAMGHIHQESLKFNEGYKISGDWQNLDIDHDDLEVDDAFPGDTVWSVGRGGPNSEMFYFTAQNTGTHFATIIDIGNGTWKVELANGEAVTDPPPPYKKWAEAEAAVKTVYNDQTVDEGWQTVSPIDKERYTEIPGLEGPFMTMSGKVVYYDPKEGKYYDRDSDMYLDYDEWKKYDSKPDWSSKEDED